MGASNWGERVCQFDTHENGDERKADLPRRLIGDPRRSRISEGFR